MQVLCFPHAVSLMHNCYIYDRIMTSGFVCVKISQSIYCNFKIRCIVGVSIQQPIPKTMCVHYRAYRLRYSSFIDESLNVTVNIYQCELYQYFYNCRTTSSLCSVWTSLFSWYWTFDEYYHPFWRSGTSWIHYHVLVSTIPMSLGMYDRARL